MENRGGLLLTAEQIAAAPAAIREWLLSSILEVPTDEGGDGFLLRQNGVMSSSDGLAVCSVGEIATMLRRLAANFQALQVFFELGCDYRNPKTGERRPYPRRLCDFRQHTDVGSIPRLRTIIHDINQMLVDLRGDRDALLCRIGEHDDYHVHELTQYRIYRFWRPLSKALETRARREAQRTRDDSGADGASANGRTGNVH